MTECPFARKASSGLQKCPVSSKVRSSFNQSQNPLCQNEVDLRKDNGTGREDKVEVREENGTGREDKVETREDNETVTNSCSFTDRRIEDTERGENVAVENSGGNNESELESVTESTSEEVISSNTAKCPFGYDSPSFKLGPLSCILCKALLFDTCRCSPCRHIFCRNCISRFRDCPLCGADIESIEPDSSLQVMVDVYIEGHGRIHRSIPSSIPPPSSDTVIRKESKEETLKYMKSTEDVSLDRGSFLLQQAVWAFQAGNVLSAKSRLSICLNDTRTELQGTERPSREIVCQLGAILGLLGDCCRAMGEQEEAVSHYSESANLLMSLEDKDLEVVHALSVSLNKQGDLCYYSGDLISAREFYVKALEARQTALRDKNSESNASLVLDVAVSLAKVADIERSLGNEKSALDGFSQAAHFAESVVTSDDMLERRKSNTIKFIHDQM